MLGYISSKMGRWSDLGETEADKITEIFSAIADSDQDEVLEIENIDPDSVPAVFEAVRRRYEGAKHCVVASFGGCECGRPNCPDDSDPTYHVAISSSLDDCHTVLRKRAEELGMGSAEDAENLGQRLREVVEKALAGQADLSGGTVQVGVFDVATGELKTLAGEPIEDERVKEAISGMATEKKRTVH